MFSSFDDHSDQPLTLQIERRVGEQTLEALRAMGHKLIVQGDEFVGVLGNLARRDIDEDEFAYLGILAQQAAISIKSAQLFEENRQLRLRTFG